jgi:putative peptide zinc metalloprotease protein
VAGAAVAASLGWAWWPDGGNYRPIQAYERGTVLDAIPASLVSPSGSGLQEGRTARADQAVWVSPSQLPTPDEPQLALVLVPASEAASGEAGSGTAIGAPESPAWVFPFAPPGAPGDGDNQALAVNTGDGSTVYDVAFALVWADDGAVTSTNEAYALASCRDCRTVAVGFQVVLVLGQADVVVPQNLSAAVNYSCVQCLTYALAMQLVVTLPSGLSATAMEELTALWEEIAAFGQRIQDVPLDRIQAELAAYEAAILDIIEQDAADAGAPGVTPDVDSTTAPTSTPTASASATGRTTSTPTVPTGVDPTTPSVTSSEPAPSPSQFTQGPSSTETSTASPTG